MRRYLQVLEQLVTSQKSFVVVTLVAARGSAPQDVGAKIIFTNDSIAFGTIGGGKIEEYCRKYACSLLESPKKNELKTWNLQKDIGMTCGGEVTCYFENYSEKSQWHVSIFGAGHISQELCRVLARLNIQLYCVDDRPEWLDKLPNLPNLKKVCHQRPANYLAEIPRHAFIVCVGKGHAYDKPILERCLKDFEFPYVGVIGSQAKRNVLIKELLESGLSKEQAQQFICPMGESFGGNRPEEIALSIAAQLLKHRDRK